MSRLGDMIRAERLRQGLAPKALAKKCGVSEKYLLEVESGKRIIADTEATRMLKVMGRKTEVLADFEAAADGIAAAPQQRPSAPRKESMQVVDEPSKAPARDAWMSALQGVIRSVPVKNIKMGVISQRAMPTENGKIFGAPPEKVFYLEAPDDSMSGYRIRRGDLMLVAPAPTVKSDAYFLVEYDDLTAVRKVTVQDNNRLLLQWYQVEPKALVKKLEEVKFLGQIKKVEFEV